MKLNLYLSVVTVLFFGTLQASAGQINNPVDLLTTNASEVGLNPGDATGFGGVRTRLARNTNSSFMLKFLPLTSPTATSNGFFADGQGHTFEFDYNNLTGTTSIKLINPSNMVLELAALTDAAFLPSPGQSLVGFQLYLKAVPSAGTGEGSTTLSNLTVATNVGDDTVANPLTATNGDLTQDFYFKASVTSMKLTGTFKFDWPGMASSHSQENFRFEIRALQAGPPVATVPEPSTLALAGLGLGAIGLRTLRRKLKRG